MALAPGTRFGPYEIVGPIGAGGMGEVYRARDATLGRDVALKLLPDALRHDPERMSRFEREARTLASLNHPNIAQVYGFESSALVMELLGGESLREHLEGGPLPVRKATAYGSQIARGLAAAHERGIVHRDLKPENVFASHDGHVKILDFGLARQAAPTGSGATQTFAAETTTGTGIVQGTVGYMAPEQVRGEPLDARADLFALGAVPYEMLAGQRAFRRETAAETMTAILKEDPPDLTTLRPDIGPALTRIVRHCLEKNPLERFQTARDIAFALDALSDSGSGVSVPAPSAHRTRTAFLAVGAAAGLLAAGVLWWVLASGPRDPPNSAPVVYRASIVLPEGVRLSRRVPTGVRIAMAPDGSHVVFVGITSRGAGLAGEAPLWVQSLTTAEARAVDGTDGAAGPFWSPDSRQIGFTVGNQLKRVDVNGGVPVHLADMGGFGTWAFDGTLLVGGRPPDGRIVRTTIGGGPLADVRQPTSPLVRFGYPAFLPGTHTFVYSHRDEKGGTDVYLGSLESSSSDVTLLTGQNGLNPVYANGCVLFSRMGTLLAQRIDIDRRKLIGDPVILAEGVDEEGNSGATFAVSQTGVLVYVATRGLVRSRLVLMDRSGRTLSTVSDDADYSNVELSPDGRRLAVSVQDPVRQARDIYLVDLARNVRQRLTFDGSDERSAVWSPDGRRVVFNSRRLDLYSRPADFTGGDEPVQTDGFSKDPRGISRDGRFILYRRSSGSNSSDLWLMPLAGDRKPVALAATPFDENYGALSPDARSMAYVSNESGRPEVYVMSIQDGSKEQISTGGGNVPRWRQDGREILYLAPDQMLMSVSVAGSGANFRAGPPTPLFQMNPHPGPGAPFDVTADGQRVIVNAMLASTGSQALSLIVNWPSLMPGTEAAR